MFNYEETLNQLTQSNNGGRRLASMIGAKNFIFSDSDEFIRFQFMTGAKNKARFCKITLNGNDLYDVEFYSIRKMNVTDRGTFNNVYSEDLFNLFESETGLVLCV